MRGLIIVGVEERMRRVKFISPISEENIQGILERKFPDKECPKCHENSVYAGCIETKYDESTDREVVIII